MLGLIRDTRMVRRALEIYTMINSQVADEITTFNTLSFPCQHTRNMRLFLDFRRSSTNDISDRLSCGVSQSRDCILSTLYKCVFTERPSVFAWRKKLLLESSFYSQRDQVVRGSAIVMRIRESHLTLHMRHVIIPRQRTCIDLTA